MKLSGYCVLSAGDKTLTPLASWEWFPTHEAAEEWGQKLLNEYGRRVVIFEATALMRESEEGGDKKPDGQVVRPLTPAQAEYLLNMGVGRVFSGADPKPCAED